MPIRIGSLAIAALMLGTVPVQKVFLGTTQIWANEVVVTLGNTTDVVLKSLFTSDQWDNAFLKKRVVIPAGVEIGATTGAYAILATAQADGLAGSWAGDLTLEVHGTVSGIGGVPNSGVGGKAIRANFTGKSGQKLKLVSDGLIRSGGGGGGRAGNGGQGSYLDYQDTGQQYSTWSSYQWHWEYWVGGQINIYIGGAKHVADFPTDGSHTVIDAGGYRYTRGSAYGNNGGFYFYGFSRRLITPATVVTSGGVAGNGGRGQGFDGAATAGAAAVGGGTNAGASGKSGDGGAWGASGQSGANGTSGNYSSGTAGASGGLAGFYLDGAANVTLTNTGTVQGRLQ